MELRGIKVGYVPYLPDLSQPGDRRRFPFFAKSNHIDFEVADIEKSYDIVLLTAPSNLTFWLDYRKRHPSTKFIFEMVDSLIFPSDTFTSLFQGVGRYVLGKEQHISLHYRKILFEWLRVADVVICSSSKIKRIIEQWNEHVFVSLDYMQNEVKCQKRDYNISGKLKLVWEGQGVVSKHLRHFKDVFRDVSSFCELHVITDKRYPSYGNLISSDIHRLLDELPIETFFHPWEMYKNYEMLIQCDCGIIPLQKENRMAWHKPANKLISFWFAGLPTLVSDTPAYVELMDSANCPMYCGSTGEWISKIIEVKHQSSEERKKRAEENWDYVSRNYSNEAITAHWVDIFNFLKGETD